MGGREGGRETCCPVAVLYKHKLNLKIKKIYHLNTAVQTPNVSGHTAPVKFYNGVRIF